MEFDIGAVIIGVGIGIALVMLYDWSVYRGLVRRVDRMVLDMVAEAENSMIGLDIELDRGVYFCYNSKDQQFVCQGRTVAEIRQVFGARFPTKTAYLAGGDPAVVEQFKTELLKLAQNENSTSQ
jgi:hypothetical protein